MDGVSAAATIFALIQAGEALGKTLKFLLSLKKIPDEILALRCELVALEEIVTRFTHAVVQNSGQLGYPTVLGPPSSTTRSIDLAAAQRQATELEAAVAELDTICARFQESTASEKQSVDGESVTMKEKHKQPGGKRKRVRQVFDWLLEKKNIESIRQRIINTKTNLSLYLQILNASAVEDVTQMTIQAAYNTSQINHTSQASHTIIVEMRDQVTDVLKTMQTFNSHLSGIETQNPPVSRQMYQCQANPPSTLIESFDALSQGRHTMRSGSNDGWISDRQISYRRRPCSEKSCHCQCHITTFRSSPWHQSATKLLGHVRLQYTNLPHTSRAPCNIKSCRMPVSTLHFDYSPPQWLLSRRLLVSATWGGLTGVGASLQVHVPVWLPDDVQEAYTKPGLRGDLRWFQDAVVSKTILPSHVWFGDTNIISDLVGLMVREDILLFLVEQGFPVRTRTNTGRSVSEKVRKNYSFVQYSKFALIAAEEEQARTTELHDFFFGLATEPFASILSNDPSSINMLDMVGQTPMHYAIEKNRADLLKLMLAHPACNIHTRNREGFSLLHYAAKYERHGTSEMARLLLDHQGHGLDVDVQLDDQYSNRWTPLCYALYNPDMVKLLVERGAKFDIAYRYGPCTPLIGFIFDGPSCLTSLASLQRFKESIQILKEAGLDLEASDKDGHTALLMKAVWRQHDYIRVLIECGARADAVSNIGENMLHYVAKGLWNDVQDLFSHADLFVDVDMDAVNREGKTPMAIWEARRQRYKSVTDTQFPEFLDRVRELRALHQAKIGVLKEVGSDDEDWSDGEDDFHDALEKL